MYENINKVLDELSNQITILNAKKSIDKVDESVSVLLTNLVDEFADKVITECEQNGLPKEIAMSIMAKHLTCAAVANIQALCSRVPYIKDEAIDFYKNALEFMDGDNDD